MNNVEAGVLEPALSKTKMIQVGWLLQQEATCNKTLHSCWCCAGAVRLLVQQSQQLLG